MSRRLQQRNSTVKRDDELWTEEEVIEFGLAGEEEYCDMQIMETDVPFAIEETAVVEDMAGVEETAAFGGTMAFEDSARFEAAVTPEEPVNGLTPESATTKSGRVRKKSAKLMEMEESDRLEKVLNTSERRNIKGSGRKPRGGLSDFTVDESDMLMNPDICQTQIEEKPVKVKFSLGSISDGQDSSVKSSKKDRKRGKTDQIAFLESDADYDRKLIIDESSVGYHGQSHEGPLRMKLHMSSDMTAAITASDTRSIGQIEGLPSPTKKSRKGVKRGAESMMVPALSLPVHAGLSSSVKSHHSFAQVMTGAESEDQSNFISASRQGFGVTSSDRMKDTAKPKKKRQKGYTAYMVWCASQREKLMAQNPGIDFSTVSKILGETWHAVPEKEKVAYRRKARKLSKKGVGLISTGSKPKEGVPSTTGRTGRPVGRPPLHGNSRRDSIDDANPIKIGTSPVDCAAHLKLLGESLTTIGSRLQEHRGKIAVQGSLSVLFDSLLCVLGTLMCLTTQVPELNGCPEEILANTLNNIAYIMPGVG